MRYWFATFIIIIFVYLTTYLTMHFLNMDLKDLKNIVSEFDKVGSNEVENIDESFWVGAVNIFKNNWVVCLQISFIPIPFLYNFSLFISSTALGFVIGLAQKTGMNLFSTIVLGALPHSILEFSVFILITIYAAKINKIIRGKITNKFRRNKKTLPSLREHLRETFIVFVFAITPFIFIAAIIDGYITRFFA